MCFPSSCSPAEIIIATVAEATIENTNDFPVRAWGEDVFGGIPLSHSQVHDVPVPIQLECCANQTP